MLSKLINLFKKKKRTLKRSVLSIVYFLLIQLFENFTILHHQRLSLLGIVKVSIDNEISEKSFVSGANYILNLQVSK